MKCTKCQQEMREIEKRTTNNGKKGKAFREYERTLYHCVQDDIWISIETPT